MTSTTGDSQDICDWPSARVIEVYYSKINTVQEPQYEIKNINHYSVKKK